MGSICGLKGAVETSTNGASVHSLLWDAGYSAVPFCVAYLSDFNFMYIQEQKKVSFWKQNIKEMPMWQRILILPVMIGLFVVVLFLLSGIEIINDKIINDNIDINSTDNLNIGSGVYIKVGLPTVYVGTTKEAHEKITKAVLAKDAVGVAQFLRNGDVIQLAEGTKVLVIDFALGLREVRVLEGDNFGKSAWLPKEWISKSR